ncbi:hypothetical protein NQ318_010544 [Aromia moschata]|uniref:HTH CENPB-type domain-containing protein n=1 Tax=Aromia moschata TaxID=1265417 RepID=A0AAV8YF09_9CUCU|nr:hypothetical protein NQ318_010544 [Aromia moschata]
MKEKEKMHYMATLLMNIKMDTKKYDEIQLKNALLAIRNGMPVATASKTLNVPRTTLRHKIAGRAPETIAKRGPDCLLGQSIEDKLCVCLKECAGGGFPKLSREIYKQLGEKGPYVDKVPGKTWYGNFMKRHPELSYKQSEYLNKARATVTEDKIRGWFKKTLELLGEDAMILEDPPWILEDDCFNLVLKEKHLMLDLGLYFREIIIFPNKTSLCPYVKAIILTVFEELTLKGRTLVHWLLGKLSIEVS